MVHENIYMYVCIYVSGYVCIYVSRYVWIFLSCMHLDQLNHKKYKDHESLTETNRI